MLTTCPDHAQATDRSGQSSAKLAFDWILLLALAVWVVASRIPYLNHFSGLGKDGPLYIRALALDEHYDVPMPGNIGYVLLGKLASLVAPDAVSAFLAVNIALTALGVAFCYRFFTLFVPRVVAAAVAFALSCNAIVWYHGAIIASYPVWFAALPAIGWFGVRYKRGGQFRDLVGVSAALGLGMILRPDLLFFGGPLWLGCLALGRARWRHCLVGGSIVALACACWFLGTAYVVGGVEVYLERIRAKHEWDGSAFSLFARGLVEGLMRNGVKYVLFLTWGASLALVPCVWGVRRELLAWRARWQGLLLAVVWVGPSWYFSFAIFAGNAGLIFPLLPLVYLAAARGFQEFFGRGKSWRTAAGMVLVGVASLVQFVGTPLRPVKDQRDVILNVMLLRYSGAGIAGRYNYNLDDYGVLTSLASISQQMRAPEQLSAEHVRLRRTMSAN